MPTQTGGVAAAKHVGQTPFFYETADGGQEETTLELLPGLLKSGVVSGSTRVWLDGLEDWTELDATVAWAPLLVGEEAAAYMRGEAPGAAKASSPPPPRKVTVKPGGEAPAAEAASPPPQRQVTVKPGGSPQARIEHASQAAAAAVGGDSGDGGVDNGDNGDGSGSPQTPPESEAAFLNQALGLLAEKIGSKAVAMGTVRKIEKDNSGELDAREHELALK